MRAYGRRWHRWALGLLALSSSLGCDSGNVERELPQGAIVILLDTLRADHVSAYGYERRTTPSIDALAAQGVRFAQVVSSAPWTLPATGALLAADHPDRVFGTDNRLQRSLVEEFSAQGFATTAFTEGAFVSRHFGFDIGFDTFHEEEGAVVAALEPGQKLEPGAGDIAKTFGLAQQWLRRHRKERFLLLIHTYEPHTPYTAPSFTEGLDPGRVGERYETQRFAGLRTGEMQLTAAEREWTTALYDGDIRRADRFVGRLISFLSELDLDQRTVVVVAGDHGEELGEHFDRFIFDHGHSLHDELLLVPLIVHDPTRNDAGRVVDQQVRLIDTLPTVAELLGVSVPSNLGGRSLVPFMDGEPGRDRTAISSLTRHGPPRVALRDSRFKFIRTTGPDKDSPIVLLPTVPDVALYDLQNDPGETRNIADEHPELVKRFGELLDIWSARQVGCVGIGDLDTSDMDAELLERLRSLGYTK